MSEKQIHWFPGHMKKAQNEIEAKLKIVDCVIELLDARIPFSSRNNYLYKLSENKARLIVLTKADLADKKITDLWVDFFKNNNTKAIFVNLNNQADIRKIINETTELGKAKQEKALKRGMKPQPIRAMIIGIPNVGKSTLINKLANRKAASVENKPGHTKSQQWIKVNNQFELLDTPGILQSNYEDKEKAVNLALTGSINQNILPTEDLADYLLDFLRNNYEELIKNRYKFDDLSLSNQEIFETIAKNRGYLTKGEPNSLKAMETFLYEFKNGIIGQCTLEKNPKNI